MKKVLHIFFKNDFDDQFSLSLSCQFYVTPFESFFEIHSVFSDAAFLKFILINRSAKNY